MNYFHSTLLFFLLSFTCVSQPLVVSENGHYLKTGEGDPFFWLGDTAWELFHRLDRNEAEYYLQKRSETGFNVIQAVVLYELQSDTPNDYGDFPLIDRDITSINITPGKDPDDPSSYDYWDHTEFIIQEAISRNIFMGILPCWGEYVTPRFGKRIIDTVKKGYDYGWFIGNFLKPYNDHIIWILGGDRLPDEQEDGIEIWRAMAEGITDAVNGNQQFDGRADYSQTFMTYHCFSTSSRWFHRDDWIDMHTWGSYHEKRNNDRAWRAPYHDWKLPDPKPTLNSEPAYELLAINYDWKKASHGFFDSFDVRQTAYWSVFSGTCGHTYGCHPVWQMYKEENPNPPLTDTTEKEWYEALDTPGALHMRYLKQLMLSRPYFSRIPDKALLAENPYDPTGQLVATSGNGYAMIYIPTGKEIKVQLEELTFNKIKAWWYNPRTGEALQASILPNFKNTYHFDAPGKTERGNDWILILDDASRDFRTPGEIK